MAVIRVADYMFVSSLVLLWSFIVIQVHGQVTTLEPELQLCECSCEYYDKLQKWKGKEEEEKRRNVTVEEKMEEAEAELKINQRKLSVNRTTLSSTTRKLVSVPDNRTVAVGLGYMGALFLGFVVAGVITCDLISLKKYLYTARTGKFVQEKESRKV